MNETSPVGEADNIRHKLLETFEKFKPSLQEYYEYAQRISALGLEYHSARLKSEFPDVKIEELSLITTLDSRETPKSLDAVLAALPKEVVVRRIIYDRIKHSYHLFS